MDETNGTKPINQISRDNMAQNDHDKLVEYGVMLKNIMDGQLRLEGQIKDLIQGQATSLASWEASSNAVHETQDLRIRKLEDLAVQYVPVVSDLVTKNKTLMDKLEALENNKLLFVGGWKTLLFVGSIIAALLGLIISIFNSFKQ